MKFIVQNLPEEEHFYACASTLKALDVFKNKAWQQNNKKVEIRVYDDDMEKLLHTEIMSTIV